MNYYYITGHGISPGTKPNDLRLGESLEIIDEPGFKTIFKTSRELTGYELDFYDISRWCPECGNKFATYPSLSRKDNLTRICPSCGMHEAMEDLLHFGA